jgi:hypothetical protein
VRVVDGQHQWPGELPQRPADGLGGVTDRDLEETGKRAEGEGPGGRVALGPDDGRCVPPETASASRASRVLPTPAGPAITIPAAPGRIAAATLRSSSSRPVSGHSRFMASG